MNAERLSQMVQAYGADPRRWPASERAAAQIWMSQNGGGPDADGAERLLFDARQTDAALDASPRPVVSKALRDRVIASATAAGLSPRRARLVWDRLVLWFGAGWAAAACAGIIAGANLTQQLSADERADAVLYQSTLAGVDDTEVLG